MNTSTTNGIPAKVKDDIIRDYKRTKFWNILTVIIVGLSFAGSIVILYARHDAETFFNGFDLIVVLFPFAMLFLHFKVHSDFKRAAREHHNMGEKI